MSKHDNTRQINQCITGFNECILSQNTPCYTLQKLTGSDMNLASLTQEGKGKLNVSLSTDDD